MKTDSLTEELIELCTEMARCRRCQLPKDYGPQLKVPFSGYRPGGVCFVQINPGHIGSLSEAEIKQRYKSEYGRSTARQKAKSTRALSSAQRAFVASPTRAAYESYRERLLQAIQKWGWPPGKYVKVLEAHGVRLENVAVINLAQCPVPQDSYSKTQLQTCWQTWTRRQLEILAPKIVIAQGKQVFQFLEQQTLPPGTSLIEGVHHADRRSSTIRTKMLHRVNKETAAMSSSLIA